MARRQNARSSHWLNDRWWILTAGEWIGIVLAFVGLVVVFCLFFIRRHTLEYKMEHSFAVSDSPFIGSALSMSDPVLVSGNKIELLQNGDAYFPAMLEAIRGAKQTVNFQAYIFGSDEIGRQFRDAFIDRARAGVRVRLLLDGIGSGWKLKNSDVRLMKEAGCKFAYYHPVHSWRVDRTNRRSHRRVMVVDGKVAFTGAAAFTEQWSGHAQDPKHWRDMQARIEGPLVAKLQGAFQEHWIKTFGEALSGAGQFPQLPSAGDLKAQVVLSHSFSAAPIPLVQAVSFSAATKRIWITNAYCTPTDNQVDLLVNAVKRHVDVRLILPGKNDDQPLTKSAGRAAYGRMLEGGVKIFEYQSTMIHAKTMVVDGEFAMFGSSNFDARSSEINEELDVVVYDRDFAQRMESAFQNDLAQSQEYTLKEFQNRSLWERTTEWLALPFRSQM